MPVHLYRGSPPVPAPSSSPEPLPVPSSSQEPLPAPSGSPEHLLGNFPKKILGGTTQHDLPCSPLRQSGECTDVPLIDSRGADPVRAGLMTKAIL